MEDKQEYRWCGGAGGVGAGGVEVQLVWVQVVWGCRWL